MTKYENPKQWNRGAESAMVHADERLTGVHEKMDGMQSYVSEFTENANRVASLLGSGFVGQIAGSISSAELYAKQNEFLIPKDVKELGSDHEIAFVLALAEELKKPEYNQ